MVAPIIKSIALDLGTTSIKAGLLDQNGMLSNLVSLPAPEMHVIDGRYESDALSYAATAGRALHDCMIKTEGSLSLGLCSQRSSFLIWNKTDGLPLTPLISWQDNRGAASCEALRAQEDIIRELTGLRLTPYYFAPKLRIVLQEHPEWHEPLKRGEFLAGTLDTFLIWRWSSGKHYVTDVSMAARTLLMDVNQLQWSPDLCSLFGIPPNILPQIKSSAGMNLRLDNGLTLQASVGDQSAALIASVREDGSEALINLGTGGFVIRYLSDKNFTGDGYLRTLVYQDNNLITHTALEGTLNSIAAALAPYPVKHCRVNDLAETDIFCLAEPSGLGAPYFRNDLGLFFSGPIDHLQPRQIASLLLEGIIFRVTRILEDFHRESALERIYLSGGLSELACLQLGIAQCAPCAIYRLRQKDSSLQGAALLAAGMATTNHREIEKIEIAPGLQSLHNKYKHWLDWFDTLLKQ